VWIGRITDLYDNRVSSHIDIESMERSFHKESGEVLFRNDGWRLGIGIGLWIGSIDIIELLLIELIVIIRSFIEWSTLIVWIY